jgi:hypothetical protein
MMPLAHRKCALLAISGALGCSFQNFDYLKNDDQSGAGGRPGSGGSSGAAGTALGGQAGGDAESDGDAAGSLLVDGDTSRDAAADAPGEGSRPSSGLVNPSFEEGYTGWLFEPTSAMGRYAYTQYPTAGAVTVDGQNELATWAASDAFTVKVFQSFVGLANGRYTFKGYFNRGDGHNAVYMYAANCGGADRQQSVPLTGPTQWLQVGIGGIDVTAGRCEVGFFVDANATNWLNADAFAFDMDPQ